MKVQTRVTPVNAFNLLTMTEEELDEMYAYFNKPITVSCNACPKTATGTASDIRGEGWQFGSISRFCPDHAVHSGRRAAPARVMEYLRAA